MNKRIQTSWRIALTMSIALALSACGGNSDSDDTTTPRADYYSFDGQVSGYYTDSPIANGELAIAQNGRLIATANSDANGDYSFDILTTDVDSSLPFILSGDAQGFAEAAQQYQLDELLQGITLTLPPVNTTSLFQGNAAADLDVDGEVLVELDSNSFVDTQGNIVEGEITAELFVIDPEIDIRLMPGEMITLDANGLEAPIESFGAITATFTDSSGEQLQLADGATANIRIPASGTNPPTEIPLFYFDAIAGMWIEEGSATLVNGFYEGVVSHFTTWNADRIYDTIIYSGCVVDSEDNPVDGARIGSRGIDYSGTSSTYSDADGNFSIPLKMDSSALISAESNYQSRTIEIETGTTDDALTECISLDEATTKITLTWGADPSDLDSHLFGPITDDTRFHIYYSSKIAFINGEELNLDVDDTSSFGPEVVTIPRFTQAGNYKYAVHNYSGTPNIEIGETLVEAIIDGIRYPITPPTGDAMEWWHVFEIDVANDLSFTITMINQWSDSAPESGSFDNGGDDGEPEPMSIQRKGSITKRMVETKYYAE